ncbi:ribosome maturation factor RimM [Parabacteroides sp. PF5-9]|uniref:ribosome maturation factor RimM n=1 Tax=Parabacteroides sp. PF5-9 TaxID=1742404 RepID=UPI0024756BE8|nr:ribosome maturation factor RimM [Parabacteroides sp. PF5-9]MDH6356632.1 16S rRNA processing protein RimM [Parabacteroides sp. PF5-9]
MINQEDTLKIGRFAKPHGVKGELALVTNYDLFEESDDPYLICDIDGILVPFYIEEYRYKGESIILVKLEYVDNEDSAREFINRDVYYPIAAMAADNLSEGITWDNFIGYTVSDKKHGLLGKVIHVDESTINVLLHIDYKGEELLFPAAEELITEIDHPNKQMTVFLPEGLLDL